MRFPVILSLLAVGACGHVQPVEPVVRTVTVTVPGPLRPCVPKDTPGPGVYADAQVSGKPAEDKLQAVVVANAERKRRLDIVEPILAGCR